MNIVITHNAVGHDSSPDDRDVITQVEAVASALKALGHQVETLACDLDLQALKSRLERRRPDLVFNLVESLAGTGRLISLVPAVLDSLNLRYTGAGTEALFLTSNKVLAKSRLRAEGLPTPDWIGPCGAGRSSGLCQSAEPAAAARWIIKSVWEHASIGLDSDSIVESADAATLQALARERAERLGGASFCEAFVAGREFNLSVLERPDGPRVLPAAEIVFKGDGYRDENARIVDYRAKWDESSYEYLHTQRSFDFGDEDRALLEHLQRLALSCWRVFDLKGYARVDFRVDAAGRPWILEVNANPCISPDAGFAAAVERAGIGLRDAIREIAAAA